MYNAFLAGDFSNHSRTSSLSPRPRSALFGRPPTHHLHTAQNTPSSMNTPILWPARSPEYLTWRANQRVRISDWGLLNRRLRKTPKQQQRTGKTTRLTPKDFLTRCQQFVSRKQKWLKDWNRRMLLKRNLETQKSNRNPSRITPLCLWWCPIWADIRSKRRRANTKIRWENRYLL